MRWALRNMSSLSPPFKGPVSAPKGWKPGYPQVHVLIANVTRAGSVHKEGLHGLHQQAAPLGRVAGPLRSVDDDGVLGWEGHLGAVGLPGLPGRPRHDVRASCGGQKTGTWGFIVPIRVSHLTSEGRHNPWMPQRSVPTGFPDLTLTVALGRAQHSQRGPPGNRYVCREGLDSRGKNQRTTDSDPKIRTQRTMGLLILRGHVALYSKGKMYLFICMTVLYVCVCV